MGTGIRDDAHAPFAHGLEHTEMTSQHRQVSCGAPPRGLSRRVRELKAKGVEFTRDIVVYDYGHDDRPMLGATVARFGFARSSWCTGFSGFP